MVESEGLRIVDSADDGRYEARLDGKLVGWVDYRDRDGRRILIHTEVDPSMEGKGIGSRLAAGALDDVRARGVRAHVLCPFITSYLERHHEHDDIVDRIRRGRPAGPAAG